ncbi:hypothetical protein FBU30_009679 [Linnemannia zychae]|nr:hypothetical protein FBU30_009679 [Linnemannia zychae]
MDIDTLLTSTLNQVVVSEDSAQTSVVSPNTIEALVKISLIAPYKVLSRVIQSILINRGQGTILIQAILGLGQLAWLRIHPTEPTLLITVLQGILLSHSSSQPRPSLSSSSSSLSSTPLTALNTKKGSRDETDPRLIWNQPQQDNLVDFVTRAMTKRSSTTGMVLLDPTEFLIECVAPYLDAMDVNQPNVLFQPLARILLKMYEQEPIVSTSTTSTTIAPHTTTLLENKTQLPLQIQLQILHRLLQLRTQENPWTVVEQNYGRKANVDRCGGVHLDYLSRLCEAIVADITANVHTLFTKYDPQDQASLQEFGQLIQEESLDSIDFESRLVIVPLLEAYNKNLPPKAQSSSLQQYPRLPIAVSGLCGHRLDVFEYSEKSLDGRRFWSGQESVQNVGSMMMQSMDRIAEALVVFLDVGRMCDDVLADMVQALDGEDPLDQTTQHILQRMIAPALYRVLSISTRLHQAHRLLIHALPTLSQLCGGPSDSSLFWDDPPSSLLHIPPNSMVPPPKLGSYWDDPFHLGKSPNVRPKEYEHKDEEEEEEENLSTELNNLLKTVHDALRILLTLESVLRLSLQPLPSKNTDSVLCVYQMDLGYDVYPDRIVSLIQSTFKLLQIPWEKVPLDLVLFCFMKICKMSSMVNMATMDPPVDICSYPNRLMPTSSDRIPFAPSLPPLLSISWTNNRNNNNDSIEQSLSDWRDTYRDVMRQPLDTNTQEQLVVAYAKARDELVLMAMNLSEALVTQQDAFYGKAPDAGNSSENRNRDHAARKRGRGRGRARRGRQGQQQQQQHNEPRERNEAQENRQENVEDELEAQEYNTSRDHITARQAMTTSPMDKSTQAWFNSLSASPSQKTFSPTVQNEDSNTEKNTKNSCNNNNTTSNRMAFNHPSRSTHPITIISNASEKQLESNTTETSPRTAMLNSDQIDCLELALTYLPAQERQAVRSRLFRLLDTS